MNENIYHGTNQPNTDDIPYRKLMCAVIWQAVNHALGRGLSDILNPNEPNYNKKRVDERAHAVAFIMSEDFEFDCELLGIDDQIDGIRQKVTRGEIYQIPAFTAKLTREEVEKIREIAPTCKRKEVAERYHISERHVGKILAHEVWA